MLLRGECVRFLERLCSKGEVKSLELRCFYIACANIGVIIGKIAERHSSSLGASYSVRVPPICLHTIWFFLLPATFGTILLHTATSTTFAYISGSHLIRPIRAPMLPFIRTISCDSWEMKVSERFFKCAASGVWIILIYWGNLFERLSDV